MEEKTLFEGRFTKFNWLAVTFIILGFLIFLIGIVLIGGIDIIIEYALQGYGELFFLIAPAVCFIIALIIFLMMRNCQFVITDKRIYGRATFGKQISLPLDKVSTVTTNFLKCLTVCTSSGKISFWLITNGDEAWQIINKLIIDRQK